MAELQTNRRFDHDDDWLDVAKEFEIQPGTTYLNHGSFGISPKSVRETRRNWIDRLDQQPMDFYVRQLEPALQAAKSSLAKFMGTTADNMVFAENATFGMNIVADSFPLEPGQQVLINNHEYGAVRRIWQRACDRHNAKLVVAQLPDRFQSRQQIVDSLFQHVTPQTRIIVVSHITSPTALIMPVEEICHEANEGGIQVCIDGPHALAQLPVNLDSLGCAFYTASCHKWLAAPLGSGFLFVHPNWQELIQPQLKSWGRLLPNLPDKWFEEFIWSGTRDPSAYLSVPSAIKFLDGIGLENFRNRTKWMAANTQNALQELTGQTPIAEDFSEWYGTMAHVPLPAGDHSTLQTELWQQEQIEVPIIDFEDRWFVRVSHHLYNDQNQIDRLLGALKRLID